MSHISDDDVAVVGDEEMDADISKDELKENSIEQNKNVEIEVDKDEQEKEKDKEPDEVLSRQENNENEKELDNIEDKQQQEKELEKDEEKEPDKEQDSDAAEDENDDDNEEGPKVEFQGSGRTITLQMLLAAKLLEPGKSSMTIEYLGQKFVGDLLADGKIKSQETETIFCSPSAWAMHCKRIINPDKKSGCGWASVKYKGKKLDAYKATYLRKCQLQKDTTLSNDGDMDIDSKADLQELEIKRIILPFNTVNNKNIVHDPNTLVETVSFASLSKIQPFLVSITTSSVLLMDFHCHLTKHEVCGYLGGNWDNNSHTLAITHAFPVRNSRHDRHMAIEVEQNIQREMLKKNLILVGWYHSHPRIAAQPTLRDCDAQLEYQIKMRGISDATYTPCIGLICAPYYSENPTLESSITAYWVVPPPENRPMEYGRPMLMQFSVSQDAEMTDDIKTEMVLAIDYYRQFDNEMVKFEAKYGEESTFIEKLKTTLYSKFPREQNDFEFWNWLREHFGLSLESKFTPPKWSSRENEEKEAEAKAKANENTDIEMREIETIEIDDKDTGTRIESDASVKSENLGDESTVVISDSDKETCSKETSKEDKLLIRSLQEQLSLPSGLNMTPSPISSSLSLLQQQPPLKNSTSSTISSNATSSISPRDSPITIPSNSASPAKFEVPLPASPSPAKSDTSSTRNRNSPLPSNLSKYPSNLSISVLAGNHSSTQNDTHSGRGNTPTLHQYSSSNAQSISKTNSEPSAFTVTASDHSSISSSQAASNAMQDFLAASFSGGKYPGYSSNDYAALFQQASAKDSGSATAQALLNSAQLNEKQTSHALSSAMAAGLDPNAVTANMKDFLAQLEKSSELNYLLQSQYQYPGLAGLSHLNTTSSNSPSTTAKSAKQSKRSSRSSSNASQHQRLLEDEYKTDANKINEYLRSQEYAKMLLEQAKALNAAVAHQNYGDISSIVSAINTLPTNTSVSTTPTRKSRKSSSATQHLPPQPSMAEFNQLLHGGSTTSISKVHELLRQMETSASALSGSKQSQKQQMELLTSLSQKPSQMGNSSSSGSSSKNKQQQLQQQQQQQQQQLQQQNALSEYLSLLSQPEPDFASLMAQSIGDRAGTGAASNMPSAAELSMLFGSPLSGANMGGAGNNKAADLVSLNASIDMLGSLFASTGNNKNVAADISSLLLAQGSKGASVEEISNFLVAAGHQPLLGATTTSTASSQYSTKNVTSTASSHPYYSQSSLALDKAQQDLIALYNANPITSSIAPTGSTNKYGSTIPDPLSKTTLAANNMFMSPSSIYAKMQQDAINAMIMKPPTKTSNSGSKTESKSRETSASPAARNYNRDSPSISSGQINSLSIMPSSSPSSTPSPSSAKHNFSVVDLAVSSVSSNPPSSRSPIIKASNKQQLDDASASHGIDPEALAIATAQHYNKKRMEFSSIADLVSPPSKMMKYADSLMNAGSSIDLAKNTYADDKDGALNLSADTSSNDK